MHHAAGRLPEAERHAQVALSVARAARDDHLLGGALMRLGTLHHEAGRFGRAHEHLLGARDAFTRVAAMPAALDARLALLRLQIDHGRVDLLRARSLARELDALEHPWVRGEASSALGVALALAGETSEAAQTFQVAAALLASHPIRGALVTVDRGWVDVVHGDRGAALDRLGQVPECALVSVAVRLALRALRRRLARG